MKVIFYDKMRETMESVWDVIEIQSVIKKVNGRNTNVWLLTLADRNFRSFKKKDYEIRRVEI